MPVEAQTAKVYQNFYAATGQVLHEYEIAGREQVDHAISVAAEAQKEWAKRTPIERGRVLRRAAAILDERNDELAKLEAIDTSR